MSDKVCKKESSQKPEKILLLLKKTTKKSELNLLMEKKLKNKLEINKKYLILI